MKRFYPFDPRSACRSLSRAGRKPGRTPTRPTALAGRSVGRQSIIAVRQPPNSSTAAPFGLRSPQLDAGFEAAALLMAAPGKSRVDLNQLAVDPRVQAGVRVQLPPADQFDLLDPACSRRRRSR